MPTTKSHPQPPTSVDHTPPSAEPDGDERRQRSKRARPKRSDTTRRGPGEAHPDAPAGQHATGSFTGSSKKNSEKRKIA